MSLSEPCGKANLATPRFKRVRTAGVSARPRRLARHGGSTIRCATGISAQAATGAASDKVLAVPTGVTGTEIDKRIQMERQNYRGYAIWGHAIAQRDNLLEHDRYAASGTITRDTKFVEASGILGVFVSEQEAQETGLSWARAWVDNHG